ncbi:hypothetical protein V8C86DRAFT_3029441 [Haematococcus lacustris]
MSWVQAWKLSSQSRLGRTYVRCGAQQRAIAFRWRGFNMQHIANCMWACHSLGLPPLDPRQAADCFSAAQRQLVKHPNSQALASLLWSAARMNLQLPPTFLQHLYRTPPRLLMPLSPQALSNLVWALAHLCDRPALTLPHTSQAVTLTAGGQAAASAGEAGQRSLMGEKGQGQQGQQQQEEELLASFRTHRPLPGLQQLTQAAAQTLYSAAMDPSLVRQGAAVRLRLGGGKEAVLLLYAAKEWGRPPSAQQPPTPPLAQTLLLQAAGQAADLTPRDISLCLLAASRLQLPPRRRWLSPLIWRLALLLIQEAAGGVGATRQRVPRQQGSWRHQDLAHVLHCLAGLAAPVPASWLLPANLVAAEQLSNKRPAAPSAPAPGSPAPPRPDGPWLAAVLARLEPLLPQLTLRDSAQLFTLLAQRRSKLNWLQLDSLLTSFYTVRAVQQATANQLLALLQGLAALRARPPDSWLQVVLQQLTRQLPGMGVEQLAACLPCLAGLGCQPGRAWLVTYLRAVAAKMEWLPEWLRCLLLQRLSLHGLLRMLRMLQSLRMPLLE